MKPLSPLPAKGFKTYEIIGFDIETQQEDIVYKVKSKKLSLKAKTNDFYLGGLYYNDDKFLHFTNKEEMIKHIFKKEHYNKIIVATNLGFDFNALFYETKYWSMFKIIYSGSKMLSAIFEVSKNFKITFYDTGNFIPLSVKVMGDILKIPKLETPKAMGRVCKTDKEFKELLIYNKRDCEISKKFLDLLQETFNSLGAELKMTIASTSMNLFRRKYHRFVMFHETSFLDDSKYYDFIFNAYFGGRTEAFSRGKVTKARVYDINSLYPSVMINKFPHPHSVKRIVKTYLEDLNYYLRFEGVMKVDIKSPKFMKYPYLPLKYKHKKASIKLVFPLGQWTGTYTHFELRKALNLGYKILKIHKCYIYKKTFFPFRAFVHDLYNKRLEYKKLNSPLELGVKLLLNSSYGKFGQRSVKEIEFIDLNTMNKEESENFMFGDIEGSISVNEIDNKGIITVDSVCDSSFVFPIFPVYVTAYARDVLYNYIVSTNALYCDTDSVLTYDTLKEDVFLGGMKVEYDVLEGIVIKPKMYMYKTPLKDVIRLKGVSRASRKKFERALLGYKVSYEKFTKLKESIKRNMKPNSIIDMRKHIDLEDSKRQWGRLFDVGSLEQSTPLIINHIEHSAKTKDI